MRTRSAAAVVRKLRSRSWAERRLLADATVLLAITRVAVRLLPFRVIRRTIGLREGETPQTVDDATAERAGQIGWAVASAASHAPWQSSCLVQSLAAAVLLRRRGIDATLYLGVAKDASATDRVTAHAWLRCGWHGLTGERERDGYRAIASFVVTRGPRRSPQSPER